MRSLCSQARQSLAISFALVAAVTVHSSIAQAAIRTYIVDPNQSTLTASGNLYGEAYQAQGAGSLTTNYTGTIKLDVNPDSIQFVGGSVIDANTSGDWMPAPGSGMGTAPADYGAFTNDISQGNPITIHLASRELIADLTSGVLPVSAGNFSADGITFSFTQGHTDWTVILDLDGQSQDMGNSSLVGASAGNAGGVGSMTQFTDFVYETWRLTLPLNISIPLDANNNGTIDSLFVLTGQLVADLRTASYGDFDGDGDVDGADFVIWQTSFPETATGHPYGDADGDGDVDGADFVVWQTNFPFTPGHGVATVPEPASWMLALVLGGAALTVGYGRRFGRRC